MLSTRTRTTLVALVASVSFAVTTVAPAVSQARPKTVTTKKVTAAQACNSLWETIARESIAAEEYEKKGDNANAKASWTAANLLFDVWNEQGCGQVVGASTTAPVGVEIASPHNVQAVVRPQK